MIQLLSKALGARPMSGRDAEEAHRAATPLELLFDLVSVIAIASAYDNDDPPFRLLTLLSMAGALTIAAGIPAFNESTDLRAVLAGFIVMRIAMVALWPRAAYSDTAGRRTAIFCAPNRQRISRVLN